jgi:hypothetical protein
MPATCRKCRRTRADVGCAGYCEPCADAAIAGAADHFKTCARCGQVVITRAEVAVCAMCRAPAMEPRHEALCLFTPAPTQMPGQTVFGLSAENPGT